MADQNEGGASQGGNEGNEPDYKALYEPSAGVRDDGV
jgi:hypothetical protein